jgi:hypothetical protein
MSREKRYCPSILKIVAVWTLATLLCLPLSLAQIPETFPAVAYGVKELKTIDMYFGYNASLSKNTYLSKILNFTPIDGVYEVKVALIRVVSEQTGNPTTYIWINTIPCNTPSIYAKVSGQYVYDYDCTNVINNSGTYNVTILSTGDLSNVHFRAWITYVNNPINQTLEFLNAINETIIREHNYTNTLIIGIDKKVWKTFQIYADPNAVDPIYYCIDNTTLMKETPKTICINNTCENVTITETIPCKYGCDLETNSCKPPSYLYILIIIGIVIVIFVIYKLVTRWL